METSDYGNTDLNAIIEGDSDYNRGEEESFAEHGFSKTGI